MTFDEYQELARTTRLPTADELYAVMNLAAEAGEVAGKYAKFMRDNQPYDDSFIFSVKKELGDVLWHLAAICDDLDCTLEEVAEINLGKLKAREKAGTLQGSGDNR